MSDYLHVYCGPCLVYTPKAIEQNTVVLCCQTNGCVNCHKASKDAFCPKCGASITAFASMQHVEINIHVLTDTRHFVCLRKSDVIILGSNGDDEPRVYHFDYANDFSLLSHENMQQDIAWFEQTYATQIKKIQEVFTDAHVTYGMFIFSE